MGDRRARSATGRPPGWFVVIFLALWSAITLLFDGILGFGAVRQFQARSFAAAPAVITRSELKEEQGEDRPVYKADIAFRFTVGGREYTSTRWRFGQWSTPESAMAQTIVARYPVGRAAVAHYKPSDPSVAVLEPGLGSQDGFLMLLMGPFNSVMLAGWLLGLGRLGVGVCAPKPLGGARVQERAGILRVRLPAMLPPALKGLAAYGAVTFVLIFVVGFGIGLHAPFRLEGALDGGAALFGTLVWGVSRFRLAFGRRDLVLDPVRGVLTLPGRLVAGTLPLKSVERVGIAKGNVSRNDGTTSAKVVLVAGGQRYELTECWTREGAESLAAFLRDRLRCPSTQGGHADTASGE